MTIGSVLVGLARTTYEQCVPDFSTYSDNGVHSHVYPKQLE